MTTNPQNIVSIEWRIPETPVFNRQIFRKLPKPQAMEYLVMAMYELIYFLIITGGAGAVSISLLLEKHIIPFTRNKLSKDELAQVFYEASKVAAMRSNYAVVHKCDAIIAKLKPMEKTLWLPVSQAKPPGKILSGPSKPQKKT